MDLSVRRVRLVMVLLEETVEVGDPQGDGVAVRLRGRHPRTPLCHFLRRVVRGLGRRLYRPATVFLPLEKNS